MKQYTLIVHTGRFISFLYDKDWMVLYWGPTLQTSQLYVLETDTVRGFSFDMERLPCSVYTKVVFSRTYTFSWVQSTCPFRNLKVWSCFLTIRHMFLHMIHCHFWRVAPGEPRLQVDIISKDVELVYLCVCRTQGPPRWVGRRTPVTNTPKQESLGDDSIVRLAPPEYTHNIGKPAASKSPFMLMASVYHMVTCGRSSLGRIKMDSLILAPSLGGGGARCHVKD